MVAVGGSEKRAWESQNTTEREKRERERERE